MEKNIFLWKKNNFLWKKKQFFMEKKIFYGKNNFLTNFSYRFCIPNCFFFNEKGLK